MNHQHHTVAVDTEPELLVVVLVVHQVLNLQHHMVAVDTEPELLVVVLVVHQVMSRQHHTVAVDTEPELLVVVHHSNHQQVMVLVLVLVLVLLLVEAKDTMLHHTAHKLPYKHTQLMLKVFSKIQTHKLFVDQLLVAYKPTHKTLKFASFNHHLFHHQAHSSSEKCAHLNHQFHPHFVFVNKLLLFLNFPHSFFVNVHHNHQLQLLHKLLFVA
jgi:hypothetical protein